MENWKEILPILGKKLTAPLAFAVLVILSLGLFGGGIPAAYQALIYFVVIAALILYAAPIVAKTLSKPQPEIHPPEPEPKPEPKPLPAGKKEEETQPQKEAAAARESYLDALILDFSPLRLIGVDEHAGDPGSLRLSLEDVYIELNTTAQVEKGGEQGEQKPGAGESRPLAALEALLKAKSRRMALLGLPGTGKSTFVRYLALNMAKKLCQAPDHLKSWKGELLLPVALSLGRFAVSLAPDSTIGTADQLERFLVSTLEADPRKADFAPYLLQTLRDEGGLFLFDGLDEVTNLTLRPVVVQAIESFVERYAKNVNSRFLATCRTYSYQDTRWQLTNWPRYELALLEDKQISQFVTAWYDTHSQLDQSRTIEYAGKKGKLLKALEPEDRRRLLEIARYPIILTMMAVVHAHYELPDSRAQVYQKCVDLLLEKWNAQRPIQGQQQTRRPLAEQQQTRNLLAELNVPRSRLDQALYEIAYKAHETRPSKTGSDSGGLITEGLVWRVDGLSGGV